jgi:signal transduction histidine kinase/DNA-binding response OmpR family regulator/HAMP domain-containing protein
MNWFRNLKIFQKLLISFSVLFVITIIIGALGYRGLEKSNNLNEQMYKEHLLPLRYIDETINDLFLMNRELQNKITSVNERDIAFHDNKMREYRQELEDDFKRLAEMSNDKADQAFIDQFEINWQEYQKTLEKIDLIASSNKAEDTQKAHELNRTEGTKKIDVVYNSLNKLKELILKRSENAYNQSETIFSDIRNVFLIFLLGSLIITLIISYYTSVNIISPIRQLTEASRNFSSGNLDVLIEYQSKDETGILASTFSSMVEKLKSDFGRENWLKDGINKLSAALSGDKDLTELSNSAVSFVTRYLEAGMGALYVFNPESKELNLLGSFAFTEREHLSNSYKLGEGVIGQAALEKQPILLKNIVRNDRVITTGTVSEPPLNTYTFPLQYENQLYGVLEVASFKSINNLEQDFLKEANAVISSYLYSAMQSEKVKNLLEIAEESQKEAQEKSVEVQAMNAELEERQQQLQQQTEELQQTNAQMEEQQQQLQQQAEELQQSNAVLELQKQQVQQQEEETRQINTKLLEARKELDTRAEQLEFSNKYKSEFLANMSHELRTPLNSVILLSQILARNKKQNLEADDIEKLNVINNAGNELLRLINDILDLSKIESGKVVLEVRKFPISEILEEQVQYFSPIAAEKNLEFIVRNELSNPDAVLENDSQKISQILRNFLSNALKFTDEGSVSLIVSDSDDSSRPLKISVQDSGVGIPKGKQDLIFEAFRQVDGTTSRVYGGTGLGLSIALELARLLGGKITLASEENHGSTFSLLIPYFLRDTPEVNGNKTAVIEKKEMKPEKQEPVKEPPRQKAPAKATKINDDRFKIGSGDKVILIIEDDPDFARSVAYVNQEMNFKSLIASTGKEGLELAEKFKPAAIILDIGLPDISGMEVLHELKTTRELRHIPVHIISGNESQETELKKQGAFGYMQKPVSETDINNILSNLVSFPDKKEKNILLVEDNDQQLNAMVELVMDNDAVNATGVRTETEAIRELDKGIYDALVVDLGLIKGSGYQICKYVKEKNLNIPVIIYTGKELSEAEEDELLKVASTIIIKTANSGERLLDEISMFLHLVHQSEDSSPSYLKKLKSYKTEVDLSGKRILIVDDDIKNAFVLTAALEQANANVLTAKNGKEGLEVIRKHPDINLVLMDIMMPVMNGYEAIEAIRADEKIRHLPVIAATAKALKDDKMKCFEAGANDYITKPIDLNVLLNLVETWVSKDVR